MRTTIDIPDILYRRLKAKAASEGRSVKSLILESAEKMLGAPPPRRGRIKLPIIKGKHPGTLHLTNEMIEEIFIQDEIDHLSGR